MNRFESQVAARCAAREPCTSVVACLLAILLILSMLPARAAEDHRPPYADPVSSLPQAVKTGRLPREVYEEATRRGTVFILIKLALPTAWQPEHRLSPAQVENQRQTIRKVQQRILDKLAGARIDNVKRYRFVPHLGMEVDALALTELVQMPEVYVIRADRLAKPTLKVSTSRIGANRVASALNNQAGSGQFIAILDTGVDRFHPFFSGRVISEGCYSTDSGDRDSFCPNGTEATTVLNSGLPCPIARCDHGTHVAGIAAGGAPGFDFSGVAPGANIIALQVFHAQNDADKCGDEMPPCVRAQLSDILLALERVYELRTIFNIAAANLSLGDSSHYTNQSDCDDDDEARFDAFTLLRGAGIAPVVSSGNSAQVEQRDGSLQFVPGLASPACLSPAISVGRTDQRDFVHPTSQTATFLDLLAPGTGVSSSVPGNAFAVKGGTSMAAPHVAGAFAVLKALDPGLTVDQILTRLRATGRLRTDLRMNPPVIVPRVQLDAAVEDQTGLPLPASDLVITNVTGTQVFAEWRDNSSSESVFRLIARPTNPLVPDRHGTALANAQAGSVASLQPNQSYKLEVRACNAANQCAAPAVVSFTTQNTLPCVPSNFRAGTVTTTSIEVRWDSNCTNPVTSFRLRSDVSGSWIPVTVSANTRSRTFSGLTPDAAYNFIIQACNADGCSPDSPTLHVLTKSAGSPPAAPTNLRLCGSTFQEVCAAGEVRLFWRDNASNEDRYELEWAAAQSGAPPFSNNNFSVAVLGPNSTSYAVPSRPSGTITYFRVRACNIAGCSAYSNQVMYTAP